MLKIVPLARVRAKMETQVCRLPLCLQTGPLLMDYILAFTALGLSGFFTKKKSGLYIGYIVAIVGRFICSFLSGFIFFAEYAPEGMNPALYSFVYNGITIGAEGIITLIILAIPVVHDNIYRLRDQFSNDHVK